MPSLTLIESTPETGAPECHGDLITNSPIECHGDSVPFAPAGFECEVEGAALSPLAD